MLALAQPQPSAAVEAAFKGFFFWGLCLRAADVLAFVSQLWASQLLAAALSASRRLARESQWTCNDWGSSEWKK
jgi:hypothetical protein